MAIIGMKIANGQFYPLLDETIAKKKKLVLAAAHENQKSVQIDLYKSGLSSMADAQYLGSLVVEINTSKEKESSIEMTISSNGKGEISASAKPLGSDKIQYLTVSIPSLEETVFDIADEELEQTGSVPNALFDTPPAKKFHGLPILLIVLLLVAVGIGIWFFLFWNKNTGDSLTDAQQTETAQTAAETPAASDAASATEAASPAADTADVPIAQSDAAPDGADTLSTAAQTAAETPAASDVAVTEAASPVVEAAAAPIAQSATAPDGTAAPALAAQTAAETPAAPDTALKVPAPVRSFKVPAKIPADGVKYKVRWGDTLWDIADVFYNDPWLINRLARYNKIRNKDLLIPGTIVRIPPKSKLY